MSVIDLPTVSPSTPLAQVQAEPTIGMILHSAVASGMDPAGLEKLAAIYAGELARRAEMSFIDALKSFRMECPALVKNREATDPNKGNRLLYRFIDLSELTKTVDPILFKYDLTYTWDTKVLDQQTVIICTLFHKDGHKRTSEFTCKASGTSIMSDAQKSASAVTFGRRYTLTGVLGLTIDEDDDGRRAVPNEKPEVDTTKPKVQPRGERNDPQDDGTPRVTRETLGKLYDNWRSRVEGPHSPAGFASWVVNTFKLNLEPKSLTTAPGKWTIDLVEMVEAEIDGL